MRERIVVGVDGYPTSRQSAQFQDVDALGGLLHADSLTLELTARTLGERRPPTMTETVRFGGLVIDGRALGDVDAAGCQKSIDQINGSGSSGRRPPSGLGAFGFRLSCGLDTSHVETDPAKGFGLNPVEQELLGPAIDFVEPVRPLDYLPPGAPMPPVCYPNKTVPAPPPPPALPALPLPAPQPPASSCQFFSTDSLANNAFGLRLGHLKQTLAAQRASSILGDAVAVGGGEAPSAGTLRGPTGGADGLGVTSAPVPATPPGAGSPTTRPRTSPSSASLARVEVRLPDWIVLAYGAWGSWALATLAIYAALLHCRRRTRGAR